MCAGSNKFGDRGFTMVEILVVIAVVSLLIALMIPAVQYAREVSRRVSCVNNLKQIGMALSNYEVAHKVYPAGANADFYSGHLMILPYLDQTSLYNSVNFSVESPQQSFSTRGVNLTVGNSKLAVFSCPSDPNSASGSTTSYAWNGGYGLQLTGRVGSFASNWPTSSPYTSVSEITDGLSNTSAMSEWRIGRMYSNDDIAVVFTFEYLSPQSYDDFVSKCQMSNRATTKFGSWSKDAAWYHGIYESTILNFNDTPNSLSCYYYGGSIQQGDYPASSLHSSGANVLFHDTHVQFFKNSVSIALWKSISSKAGNEAF